MSKKPHRKQHRSWSRRGQRVWIDIETRGPIFGDTHIGVGQHALNAQMMAYAHGSGLTEFVVLHSVHDRLEHVR